MNIYQRFDDMLNMNLTTMANCPAIKQCWLFRGLCHSRIYLLNMTPMYPICGIMLVNYPNNWTLMILGGTNFSELHHFSNRFPHSSLLVSHIRRKPRLICLRLGTCLGRHKNTKLLQHSEIHTGALPLFYVADFQWMPLLLIYPLLQSWEKLPSRLIPYNPWILENAGPFSPLRKSAQILRNLRNLYHLWDRKDL